jgi:RNA polymerase sigma-70 factor (ECF subfamily)
MDNIEPKSVQFFRLYNGAQKRVYAFLLMLVHNHTDAEDLLQETASILWEQYHQYDPRGSFAAWAIGIARNKALDFLKRKRTSRPFLSDDFYRDISNLAETESAHTDQRVKALRQCVKKLSSENQALLHLRFEKGVSVKRISQMSEHSAQAIYKKISRIYSYLHSCIHRTLVQWEHP